MISLAMFFIPCHVILGIHEIPLSNVEPSPAASRPFSEDIKTILKGKLASGEDMGGQVPIVIATHDFQGTFVPANVSNSGVSNSIRLEAFKGD